MFVVGVGEHDGFGLNLLYFIDCLRKFEGI